MKSLIKVKKFLYIFLITICCSVCFTNNVMASKNSTTKAGVVQELNDTNQLITEKLSIKKQEVEEQKIDYDSMTYLGDYRVTFYCACSSCCGPYANGITASGNLVQANHTCACGSDIPFGTKLYVEGLGYYICEDRGVGSGCIDIYVNDHSEIPSWGMDYIATYLVN